MLIIDNYHFKDDCRTPNNPSLPLLVYKQALDSHHTPEACSELFQSNEWHGVWVNGVYPYHHFHTTAHEVLGVVGGEGSILMGGENGKTLEVQKGDVLIIPAGVGHKKVLASPDFQVVGAYPSGQSADLMKTGEQHHSKAAANIQQVKLPRTDPIYGKKGPMFDHWK
ncbi:cupin domain-containing protein [Falsibacillus albus]|uniref:Cupin domain-containing protein n=1 Tax=Falsibacillus albus TaxID=2478915 RepID=A0A3L7K1F3_9BACI|nr:cupin domain-containing protein [Falsibacillus albus]RLQ96184.1 cupin domain-containing protein [Falsibacillus albus]